MQLSYPGSQGALYGMLTQYSQNQQTPFAQLTGFNQQQAPLPVSQGALQASLNQSMSVPTLQGGLNQFGANQGVAWNSPSRVAAASYAMGNAQSEGLQDRAMMRLDAQNQNANAALQANYRMNDERMALQGLNANASQFNFQQGQNGMSRIMELLAPFMQSMQQSSGVG
jgi:hypothetical protein